MKKNYVSPVLMVYGMEPTMLMAGTLTGVNSLGHSDYSNSGTDFVEGTYNNGIIQDGNRGLGEDLNTDITEITEN